MLVSDLRSYKLLSKPACSQWVCTSFANSTQHYVQPVTQFMFSTLAVLKHLNDASHTKYCKFQGNEGHGDQKPTDVKGIAASCHTTSKPCMFFSTSPIQHVTHTATSCMHA